MSKIIKDRLYDWSFDQFLIAAQFLEDQGMLPESIRSHTQFLGDIKVAWDRRFPRAPKEGAMQMYNPEVVPNVRLRIAIAWTQASLNWGEWDHPRTKRGITGDTYLL